VHAVISAVGGAGATTTAICLADLLVGTKKTKQNVALFDLDFSSGNCSYLLNMVNGFNLESVASHPERVDVEFINLIQQQHARGFYVYSFKRPEINAEINGYELVLRMLDAVNLQHEHTVLDIPYYETEWKNEVLAAVNTCTVVTQMNLPAIKHTLDIVERVKDLRGSDYPVQVIFNHHRGGMFSQRIKKSTLEELFEGTPFHYLPEDETTINESVDRGLLPSEVRPSTKFLKSLRSYMKELDLSDA
jgi:pilus assembly protein CpaE